jgi:membrane associated rhomboid family serine protease
LNWIQNPDFGSNQARQLGTSRLLLLMFLAVLLICLVPGISTRLPDMIMVKGK